MVSDLHLLLTYIICPEDDHIIAEQQNAKILVSQNFNLRFKTWQFPQIIDYSGTFMKALKLIESKNKTRAVTLEGPLSFVTQSSTLC